MALSAARNQLKQSNFLINDNEEQTSFFDHSYKNYKPFSRLTKQVNFDTKLDFGKTTRINISNNANYGDLITHITVKIKVPDISSIAGDFGYTDGFAHALFESIEFRIDGELIDKHSSEWMDIWSELTVKPGLQKDYDYLVKKFDGVFHTNFRGGTAYLPLQFWFCRGSSTNHSQNNLAFPLAALYNSNIEIIFKTRTLAQTTINKNLNTTAISSDLSIEDASLLIDYIVLEESDLVEMQRKDVNKYFLITQVQELEKTIPASTTSKVFLFKEIKYIVSELLWIVVSKTTQTKKLYFDYSTTSCNRRIDPIKTTQIKFDGVDRVEELPSEYFQSVEPLSVHDNTPFSFIHCYSFALTPEDYSQPSGICNFSEIHNVEIDMTFQDSLDESLLKLFAINYNIMIANNGKGRLLNSLSKSSSSTHPGLSTSASSSKPTPSSINNTRIPDNKNKNKNKNNNNNKPDFECY